jgi:ribosomal protein L7/L12
MIEISEETIERCRQMLAEGKSVDTVLAYLRATNVSKIASMQVLMTVMNVSLKQAKEMVHLSTVWSDRRQRDDAFHDSLIVEAEKLQKSQMEL